jgi:cytochrome c-type biogenesis protein CcmH/NrfF
VNAPARSHTGARARSSSDRVARLGRWASYLGVAVFVTWVFLLAYALGAASNAQAADANGMVATPNQQAPVLAKHRNEPQTTLQQVSSTVMCPTCDSTLDQSHSPAAERMRVWIQVAIRQGWTTDEIHSGLIKEYGGSEAILAVPRARGIGLLAWLVPAAIVLIAGLYGLLLLRRWRRVHTSSLLVSPVVSSAAIDHSSSPSA